MYDKMLVEVYKSNFINRRGTVNEVKIMPITKEWLEKQHIEYGLNFKEIAKKAGKAEGTIHRWAKIHGIKNQTPTNRIKKYSYNENYFEKIDSEEKAYFLGWIMADGYISSTYGKNGSLKQHKLRIVLKSADRELLEKFNKALNGNLPITDFIQKTFGGEYPASRIDVNCTKLCKDLIRLGVIPGKSNNESMPKLAKKLTRHFLRGLFDGDGSLSISQEKHWTWAHYTQAGSEKILLQIKKFYENQGVVFPNVFMIESKGINVLLCNKTEDVIKIIELMYKDSNFYLTRKKDKCWNFRLQKI